MKRVNKMAVGSRLPVQGGVSDDYLKEISAEVGFESLRVRVRVHFAVKYWVAIGMAKRESDGKVGFVPGFVRAQFVSFDSEGEKNIRMPMPARSGDWALAFFLDPEQVPYYTEFVASKVERRQVTAEPLRKPYHLASILGYDYDHLTKRKLTREESTKRKEEAIWAAAVFGLFAVVGLVSLVPRNTSSTPKPSNSRSFETDGRPSGMSEQLWRFTRSELERKMPDRSDAEVRKLAQEAFKSHQQKEQQEQQEWERSKYYTP